MAGIFEVADFAELAAQNTTVATIQGTLTGVSAVTAAAAATLTPPGGEGASMRAVAQQIVAVEQFAAMFTQGMLALQERVVATNTFSTTTQAVQAAQAAALSAVI
jgi:hypothetical protein